MGVLVLAGILLLVVLGCVCVVWAARGGPRWVRVVSAVTLGVAGIVTALVRGMGSSRSGSGSGSGFSSGSGSGSDSGD
ncbi:hypothetical protein [Streptomyces sp. NPDC059805]|uniref:hypothetical protein n=1 Tax=Streptomyces sp. NPDC059805 TaxID=3346954 RepID=UPI003648114B